MNIEKPLRPILVIGKLGRAHGLHGEIKVQALTSDPDRFYDLENCLMMSADERNIVDINIDFARVSTDQVLLKIQGIDTREQAEKLTGRLLAVKREQAVELPPDTWFICDLVGCDVYDEQNGFLGQLSDVMQNVAQDVYVVKLTGQDDLLFPALKSILTRVDIVGRRIDVRLPAGLFEVYRGRKP